MKRPVRLPAPLLFLGTAMAFGLFGVGGVLYSLLAPVILLFVPPSGRRQAAREAIRRLFALFVGLISGLGLVRIRVTDRDALLKPGTILAASHPSLIDVVTLLSIVPNATTIVKAALLSNPFTAVPIRTAGYAANDTHEGGEEVLASLRNLGRELDRGAVFIIFPEGTRTPVGLRPGELPRLHRGVAQLSLLTGRPITPVRVTACPRWLTKDRGWWHLPDEPMTLTFEVLAPIDPEPFLKASAPDGLGGADGTSAYNSSTRRAARELTAALARRLFPFAPPAGDESGRIPRH